MRWLPSLGLALVISVLCAFPAWAGTTTVAVRDNSFRPAVVGVVQGSRVVWVNRGRDNHTVTTRRWSVVLNPGERHVRRVRHGFRYVCAYHGAMTGRVVIR